MKKRYLVVFLALVVGLASLLLLHGCVRFDGVVDFEADVLEGKEPLAVQFTLLAQGCIDRCIWSFGDGTFSTERNPVHTYDQAGSYRVIVTVTPSRGEPASARKDDYIRVTSGWGATPPTMWCYYGDTENHWISRVELVPPFEGQNSGGHEQVAQTTGIPHDFVLVGSMLFWTDQAAKKIFATDVAPGGSSEVLTVATCADVPFGLAVDPLKLDVYWAEDDPNVDDRPPYVFRIMRVGFNRGTGQEYVGKRIAPIEDLAFDPVDRVLYAVAYRVPAYEYGALETTSVVPTMYKEYAISGIAVDVRSEIYYFWGAGPITELAVDQVGRKIYWYNAVLKTIRRANLDGTDRQTIISDISDVGDLAIDQQNRRIVWVIYRDGIARLVSAALDGSDIRYRLGNATSAQYTAIAIGPKPAWSPADLGD